MLITVCNAFELEEMRPARVADVQARSAKSGGSVRRSQTTWMIQAAKEYAGVEIDVNSPILLVVVWTDADKLPVYVIPSTHVSERCCASRM